MLRWILAAIVGGMIVTAWGAVSWMVLPFHGMSLHSFPGEEAAIEAFLHQFPEHGVYHHPGFPDEIAEGRSMMDVMAEVTERMQRGPTVTLMIAHPQGLVEPPIPKFPLGMLVNLMGACLLTAIISSARRGGASWMGGVGKSIAMAAFAVLAAVLPGWIWWGYPTAFGVLEVADVIIAWTAAGAAISAIVRPNLPAPTQ